MRPRQQADPALYEVRKEALSLLEKQAEQGRIDLFYGDETQFSQVGYVPYGWQFDDEQVAIKVGKGNTLNCFGLLSRSNRFLYKVTRQRVDSNFIIEMLDRFSWSLTKHTVVVLDNAGVHTSRKVKEHFKTWQNRGLYIFYLPPYSPHLNIIERLWKEMKQGWISPSDYDTEDDLFYSVDRICANIGKTLFLNFSPFAH